MTRVEQVEDYVEYLVQCNDVKELRELSREERAKLMTLVLLQNNMYVKVIKMMHSAIKKELIKFNQG